MSTLKEVNTSNILQKAMSIIRSAKQEILVTMDLAEEITKPLPLEYFSLLNEKMKMGIRMKRLAFGSISDFRIITQRHKVTNKNYKCTLAATKNYQRMLLVDNKYLLFTIDDKNKRRFFYTIDPQYIKKFSQYFRKEVTIAENIRNQINNYET